MLIETLTALWWMVGYYVAFVAAALLLRHFTSLPSEVSRKLLHIIAMCSIFLLVYGPFSWQSAALVCGAFAALVFPILSLASLFSGFSKLMTERKRGELKVSLMTFSVMFAVLILILWAWVGNKHLVIACVLAWGFGDATAALIGKRFGRRFLEGKLIEGRKTLEGSLAMFAVSTAAVTLVLIISRTMAWHMGILTAILTAAACTATELYTRNGMDTITCPLAAAAVLIPMTRFFGKV